MSGINERYVRNSKKRVWLVTEAAARSYVHVVSFEKSGNAIHTAQVWESEEQLNDMIKLFKIGVNS
jgi:hypothetical protein